MKIQAWKIWVCEGSIGAAHGFFYPIIEIYFPDLELAMNSAGFHSWADDRYKEKEEQNGLDRDWEKHQPKLVKEVQTDDERLISLAASVAKSISDEKELTTSLDSLFSDLFDS